MSLWSWGQLKNWPTLLKMAHSDDEVYGTGGHRVKPCRACADFTQWAQMQGKTAAKTAAKSGVNKTSAEKECPLSRDQLGRNTWSLLHTMAAYYPKEPTAGQQKDMMQFIDSFSRLYPCEHCAQDFQKDIKSDPPQTQSQRELSQWLCRIHNKVNQKLGKTLFDCNRVDERWLNGWSDGSCDWVIGLWF